MAGSREQHLKVNFTSAGYRNIPRFLAPWPILISEIESELTFRLHHRTTPLALSGLSEYLCSTLQTGLPVWTSLIFGDSSDARGWNLDFCTGKRNKHGRRLKTTGIGGTVLTIACQPYTLNQYFLMEFLANLSAVTTSFSPIKTGLATVAGAM